MESQLYTGCPVQFTLQFLAGKWRTGILWNLRENSMRFRDLKKLLPGITDKVLMQELLHFTNKGIIRQQKFQEFPPRSEYNLTPIGYSLIPIIHQIVRWGYDHLQDEKLNKNMLMTPVSIIDDLTSFDSKD